MLRQLSVFKQCKCLSVQYIVLVLGLIKGMGTKWNLNGLFFLTSYTSSSYPALECALTLLFTLEDTVVNFALNTEEKNLILSL